MIMENRENEFIDEIVETSDGQMTRIEMEYIIKDEESNLGFDDYYKEVDRGDIAYNKFTLDLLKKEISEADDKNIADVDELFMQARIAQQDARDALVDGDYNE